MVQPDVTNLANVAVTTNKNSPVRDDSGACSAVDAHQNGVFAILTCTKVVLCQRQTADIVTDKTGDEEPFFQCLNQSPVLHLNMRHIVDLAAFRIDKPRQNHGNGDELADFALIAVNKSGNGVEQRVFQRFLRPFGQRIVLFRQHFAAQVEQGDGRVVAAKTHANGVKTAGFGDDRDGAAASGGGLLIDFFDQSAFNQLTRNFGYAGGGKLALFGNLDPRDWPMLVNQAVNAALLSCFTRSTLPI